jgi:hypothetical protein
MCTVTVVPTVADGFRVVCNRDERLVRPSATSPELQRLGRRTAIYPIDPAGSGTWIGVNDAGLAVALLNRSSGRSPARSSAGLQVCPSLSRGTIVPRCLAADAIPSALTIARTVAVRLFEPFSLVLVHRRRVAVAVSDGRELSIGETILERPLLFTSSSLGDGLVDWPRRQLFEQLLGSGRREWLGGQSRFHEHQWPARPEISVLMSRQDAATVSRSVVDVSPRRIRFRYEALWPLRAPAQAA